MVPNWGWAIVIQTLIITMALLPLRITQMKSMLKMQRVAPQIKAIQEKYKKYGLRDPRKAQMNEEISGTYKREGVNPAGGCLPMLIQLPFLFAYYRMLSACHSTCVTRTGSGLTICRRPNRSLIFCRSHGRQQLWSEDDAAGRHGSRAAEDDDHDDAADDGLHLFPFGRRPEPVLCRINLISIAQQAIMNRTSLGREMREMMAKRARKKDK